MMCVLRPFVLWQVRPKKRSRRCITSRAKSTVVYIKTMAEKVFTVRVELSGTVANLMSAIQDKEGIPPDQQRLIAQGKQLREDMCLKDCFERGMFDDHVHLILRLRGC